MSGAGREGGTSRPPSLPARSEATEGVSMMDVLMMPMSTNLDPDACVHDARLCVACIYDPRSLNLMHVCMMPSSMVL